MAGSLEVQMLTVNRGMCSICQVGFVSRAGMLDCASLAAQGVFPTHVMRWCPRLLLEPFDRQSCGCILAPGPAKATQAFCPC